MTRLKIIAIGIVVMLLGGCSSPAGRDYFSLPDTMRRPPQGAAQLVFYYPGSSFWSGTPASIVLDGNAVCGLKSGTFTIRNIKPAQNTAVTVSLCSTAGTARLSIKTVAGTKYYLRITPNDETLTGLIARSGLSKVDHNPKEPPKKVVSSAGGAFWIDIIDEPVALKELQGLTLCPECS